VRSLNLIIAVVAAGLCMSLASAQAAPQPVISMLTKAHVGAVEDVGWRRRYYRRWGYPYTYYPPAYGYYYSPPAWLLRACLSSVSLLCAVSVLPTALRSLLLICGDVDGQEQV
jgi:hypothetical protein